MLIDSFIFSDKGGRDRNEDAVGQKDFLNGALFALADGLGGHLHGEMASKCVVDALLESPEPDAETEMTEWFKGRFEAANEKVSALQAENPGGMKSTAVALAIRGSEAHWAHVGDSRLYYLHGGQLQCVTEDHSVAYKKYKAGEITRAQIARDEDQSCLLRALGNPERNQPDFGFAGEPLEPGDAFLLCSDGVWEYLRDQEVLVDLLKARTAQEWAELLLLRVIERIPPGNDNLSLITVLLS